MSLASHPLPIETSTNSSANALGVVFERVSKRYGSLFALRDVSVTVSPGEFAAVLGPNGSGKSTFIKVAAQAARPTSGSVSVVDKDGVLSASEARARTGWVAHQSLTYDDLTAEENLKFFGRLYGVEDVAGRAEGLLEAVGLQARRGSLVRTFSRGMRQRLSIARALLASPGLLLLDEPSTGLDQSALTWLTDSLRELHRRGVTILMSTHGASEALTLATRQIYLEAGRVVEGA